MSRRQQKPLCNNFRNGYCRFGANCKFSHDSQNQSNGTTTNAFGFGTQKQSNTSSPSPFSQTSQQQQPNPFGFGVQNKTNPTNAFDNKWTRSGSTSAKQPEAQTQSSVHSCSDPAACKKVIMEDSKNEAPLWKLTCYGHAKNGACDIIGDISFEEMRALAYEESKQGRNLQSIVERERSLQQSKLVEFENLLRNPYVSKNTAPSSSTVTSFSQLNNSMLTSFSQLNNAAAASAFRPASSMSSSPFGPFQPQINSSSSSSSPFQPQMTSINSSSSSPFQPQMTSINSSSSSPFQPQMTSIGTFGSQQLTNQNHVSAFGSIQPTTNPNSNFSFGRPSLPLHANASQQPSSNTNNNNSSKQQQSLSLGFGFPAASPLSSTPAAQPLGNKQDVAIWLKEKWSIGEIPEEAPPAQYC